MFLKKIQINNLYSFIQPFTLEFKVQHDELIKQDLSNKKIIKINQEYFLPIVSLFNEDNNQHQNDVINALSLFAEITNTHRFNNWYVVGNVELDYDEEDRTFYKTCEFLDSTNYFNRRFTQYVKLEEKLLDKLYRELKFWVYPMTPKIARKKMHELFDGINDHVTELFDEQKIDENQPSKIALTFYDEELKEFTLVLSDANYFKIKKKTKSAKKLRFKLGLEVLDKKVNLNNFKVVKKLNTYFCSFDTMVKDNNFVRNWTFKDNDIWSGDNVFNVQKILGHDLTLRLFQLFNKDIIDIEMNEECGLWEFSTVEVIFKNQKKTRLDNLKEIDHKTYKFIGILFYLLIHAMRQNYGILPITEFNDENEVEILDFMKSLIFALNKKNIFYQLMFSSNKKALSTRLLSLNNIFVNDDHKQELNLNNQQEEIKPEFTSLINEIVEKLNKFN